MNRHSECSWAGRPGLGEEPERAAGADRGQLVVVADEQQLRPRGGGVGAEPVQVEGGGQGRLVDDDELAGLEPVAGLLPVQDGDRGAQLPHPRVVAGRGGRGEGGAQAGGDGGAVRGAGPVGFVQPLGGVLTRDGQRGGELGGGGRGRGEADHRAAAVDGLPGGPDRDQGGGLAGAGRADEHVDRPPGGAGLEDGVHLILGEAYRPVAAPGRGLRGGGQPVGDVLGHRGCAQRFVGLEEAGLCGEQAGVGVAVLVRAG